MADDSHQWSMQAVGGEYADQTMRLVIYVADSPDAEAIETNEAAATAMIVGEECAVVEAGETIGPIDAATGSCFELHVAGSDPDSLYPMVTEGLAGVVIFAQHFPTEFERDQHYLKDSAGTDIEPTAQEGGDGHDHDHDHDHGDEGEKPTCACVAEDFGFNIDCSASAAMIDSFNFMKANSCGTDCSTDSCQEAWYIVQTHHDYCPTDGIPSEIEDGFHDFDEICKSCEISRIATDGAPACPTANCEDNSGNEAYEFLLDNGCLSDCTTDACNEAYLTLRVVHDSCDHDVLTTASEEGLHDFEDVCMVNCNGPESLEDQLTCTTPGSTAACSKTAAAAGAVLAGAAFLMA
ncbi:MAG: hypothetical protein SGARI_002457 [Bacillariaceae sp.]